MALFGAVLAGGASRRMGTDKAMIEVEGRPLIRVALDALTAAGARPVLLVGGDPAVATTVPGTVRVADLHPGEGPLGGLVTALAACDTLDGASPDAVALVLACDMPAIDPDTLGRLVDALVAAPDAAVAVAIAGRRRQPLAAAWRPRRARAVLETAYDEGERAPHRVLDQLVVREVTGLDPAALADVDRPEDLRRYAGPSTPRGVAASPPDDPTEPT